MTDLRDTWEGARDRGATMDAVRWKSARSWSGSMTYKRPAALQVAVDEAAHARLGSLTDRIEADEVSLIAYLQPGIDAAHAEFDRDEPGRRKIGRWPESTAAKCLAGLAVAMRGKGTPPGSDEWVARERAAARNLQKLRDQVRAAPKTSAPVLRRTSPNVITIRLLAGLVYGRPVIVPGPGLLDVGGVGRCRLGTPTASDLDLTKASYVEAALIRRQWWLRFIFAEEAPAREKKAKKGASHD